MSEWVIINGGVPQSTRLSTLIFLVMMNDLQFDDPFESIKFKDDTNVL